MKISWDSKRLYPVTFTHIEQLISICTLLLRLLSLSLLLVLICVFKGLCCGLSPAGNKVPRGRSLTPPP